MLVVQDVTAARALQRDLAYAASHDALTGLKSRSAFEQALAEAIAAARAHGSRACAPLCRPRPLQDGQRHRRPRGGRRPPQEGGAPRSARLRRRARHRRAARRRRVRRAAATTAPPTKPSDRPARSCRLIGGERFSWAGKSHDVGASIGVVDHRRRTAEGAEAVLAHADVACYSAKAAGRNRVAVYRTDAGDAQRHMTDFRVAAGIRDAVERQPLPPLCPGDPRPALAAGARAPCRDPDPHGRQPTARSSRPAPSSRRPSAST